MNKVSLSGIIEYQYYDSYKKIKLVQPDGYKIDLIWRFSELVECLPSLTKLNISYWVSDTPKPLEEIMEQYLRQLYGVAEVGYSSEYYAYSEWTDGYYEISTLTIGGHDLFLELSSHEGKFLFLEIGFEDLKRKNVKKRSKH